MILNFKCFVTLYNLFRIIKIIYHSRNSKVIAIIYETKKKPGHVLTAVTVSVTGVYPPLTLRLLMSYIYIWSAYS